jgi:hypothetical protein
LEPLFLPFTLSFEYGPMSFTMFSLLPLVHSAT